MGSSTKFSQDKTTSCFILCDCKSEVLVIEYDHQYKIAELAIFAHHASAYRMSFWQKMRYIWQVLVYSKPYSDQMILNTKQIKDLKQFVNSV